MTHVIGGAFASVLSKIPYEQLGVFGMVAADWSSTCTHY